METTFSLQNLLEKLNATHPQLFQTSLGPLHVEVTNCSSAEASTPASLCFVSDGKQYEKAISGSARAYVLPASLVGKVAVPSSKSAIFVKNHGLVHAFFAGVMHGRYEPQNQAPAKIHPTAVVAPSAQIASSSHVGPHAFIGENVIIEDDVFIGANTVVESRSKIGRGTRIWPMVFIATDTIIGVQCHIHPNTTIGSEGYGFAQDEKFNHHRIPQLGNVILEDRVEIGSNVSIDRGTFGSTIIGSGSKLDNLIHIAHNVKIGRNCLITSGFTIGGSSTLGDNVVVGGSVTIRDHVNITSNVRLAGGSGVNNHITKPGDYGGHPLQPVRDYLKTTMCIPHLPEFRKLIRELEAEVRKNKPL